MTLESDSHSCPCNLETTSIQRIFLPLNDSFGGEKMPTLQRGTSRTNGQVQRRMADAAIAPL
ncbi:unnamed protein product, partial [Lepidochelys olivacea]